jgi:hypothetical protein
MGTTMDEIEDDYNREAVAYIGAALSHLATAKAWFNRERPRTIQQELRQARSALNDAISHVDKWEESLL